MDTEKIGKFIAKQRKTLNLTQEQLAATLGLNSRSISRWENGICMPDLSILKNLAKVLNISVSELLEGRLMTKEERLKNKVLN